MTWRVPRLPRILQLKPSLQVGRKAAINHSPNQPRWAVAAQGRSKLGGLDQPTKLNHGARKIQDGKLYFLEGFYSPMLSKCWVFLLLSWTQIFWYFWLFSQKKSQIFLAKMCAMRDSNIYLIGITLVACDDLGDVIY